MRTHYKQPRTNSPQIMALMRQWPNVNPAHVGRGTSKPAAVATVVAAPEKDGVGEDMGIMTRRAWAGGRSVLMVESRNVRVTIKRRRQYTVQ